MSNNNGKGREIFYGVIGVATLVVAIIGATFAYFTASASNNTTITGNAASINFGLRVERAENNDTAGLIPMSNSMVHRAVDTTANSSEKVCIDDNGNAVCQVYKITVTNRSSAKIFLDGYVDLTGGLAGSTSKTVDLPEGITTNTNMRWAQVFCTGSGDSLACSTTGASTVHTASTTSIASIDPTDKTADPYNKANILSTGVTDTLKIANSGDTLYEVITKNYIRVSGHSATAVYNHTDDVESALVFNQDLTAASESDTTDEVVLYIVVWLSESGTDQNPESTDSTSGFFDGTVTFVSAAGSEVSASFNGYTRVAPTDNVGNQS